MGQNLHANMEDGFRRAGHIIYHVIRWMVSRHWIVPPVPCRKAPTCP